MNRRIIVTVRSHAVGVPAQGTRECALQKRDLDGDTSAIDAYFDTAVGIIRLEAENEAMSNRFNPLHDPDLGTYSSDLSGDYALIHSAAGHRNWRGAMLWVNAMNIANDPGCNGWRLPDDGEGIR
jgi:hypothetical protein